MKELSIEEKAQRYDKALEVARKIKNGEPINVPDGTLIPVAIFPELKESEDERIRKEIMDFIDTKTIDSDERRNKWFSYLEKYKPISFTSLEDTKVKMSLMQYISELNQDVVHLHPGIETCNEWIAWIEKQNSNVYNANKEYWRGYWEGKQGILDKYAELEKQGEQKEINLVEILKHYPRETELYSPLYGKLWLAEVDEKNGIITCYKHHLEEGCTRAVFEQEDTVSFYSNGTTGLPDFNVSKDCMLFLYDIEKQGEQKPADRVKLMFKVGDWIIYDRHISKVKDMDSEGYLVEDTYGDEGILPKEFAEKHYHLWTIEDAKDGDVLYMNNGAANCIFIYKSSNNGIINKYASYNKFGFEGEHYLVLNDGYVIPATKEQRDTLEKAIADAGYTFDFEKKELKKIEQKLADKPKFKVKYAGGEYNVLEVKDIAGVTYYGIEDEPNHIDYILPDNCEIVSEQKPVDVRTIGYWHVEDVEQKPADEEMKELLQTEYEKGRADAIAEMQKHWSEEDEVALGDALWCCKQAASITKNENDMGNVWYAETWLKSLKDRMQPQNLIVTDEELAQAKKEAYNDALDKIEYHSGEPTFNDGWSAAIWYLKKRNAQPQNTWKPSDEQMEVLLSEVNGWTKGCPKHIVLESLYNDLKRLLKI